MMGGSVISWTICKSYAPRSRQINTPVPHHSVFYRPDALPAVTGQLADWTTRGLVNSRTGQLADAIGDFACLVFLFGGICETASYPVRDLSSARVV